MRLILMVSVLSICSVFLCGCLGDDPPPVDTGPHYTPGTWYYVVDANRTIQGPYTLTQMHELTFSPDQFCCKAGEQNWRTIKDYPEVTVTVVGESADELSQRETYIRNNIRAICSGAFSAYTDKRAEQWNINSMQHNNYYTTLELVPVPTPFPEYEKIKLVLDFSKAAAGQMVPENVNGAGWANNRWNNIFGANPLS